MKAAMTPGGQRPIEPGSGHLRSLIAWVVTAALAGVVHVIAGGWLAGRDVLLALLSGGVGAALAALAAAALLVSRLYLVVLAPAWALCLAVTLAMQLGAARLRDRRTPGPPGPS